jgi:hypothetical protein
MLRTGLNVRALSKCDSANPFLRAGMHRHSSGIRPSRSVPAFGGEQIPAKQSPQGVYPTPVFTQVCVGKCDVLLKSTGLEISIVHTAEAHATPFRHQSE